MVWMRRLTPKTIHGQRNPGVYASFVNDMPVLYFVYRQAKATSDLGVCPYARRLAGSR